MGVDKALLLLPEADGVPGLPGWGAKSAATVLFRYPRLELIPANATDWEVTVRSADKLAATLRDHVEDVFLYRELTTLRLDVPIAETLEDLEWQGVPREPFETFCRGLGLDPDAIRVHRWQP
jgi:5'-3' exonuclease